jgi:hypothetical protein
LMLARELLRFRASIGAHQRFGVRRSAVKSDLQEIVLVLRRCHALSCGGDGRSRLATASRHRIQRVTAYWLTLIPGYVSGPLHPTSVAQPGIQLKHHGQA